MVYETLVLGEFVECELDDRVNSGCPEDEQDVEPKGLQCLAYYLRTLLIPLDDCTKFE